MIAVSQDMGAASLANSDPGQSSGEFDGRGWPLAKLYTKNIVLTILTLGVYYFWGITDFRRYLWDHSQIDGSRFEYTGKGLELLISYAIVVIFFVLSYGFLSAADVLFLIEYPDLVNVYDLLSSTVLVVVLPVLYFVGVYRMWRYRLSRTVWRGIRFGLNGRSGQFARGAIGRFLMVIVTLGVMSPYFHVWKTRYLVNNARYGTQHFVFSEHASGGDLIGRWLLHLALVAITVVIALLFIFLWGQPLLTVLVIPAIVASYIHYRVFAARYLVNNIRFGTTSFESRLSTESVLGALSEACFVFLMFLLVTVALVLTAMVIAGHGGDFIVTMSAGNPVLVWASGVAIVGALSAGWIAAKVNLACGLTRHLLETVHVDHPQSFLEAVQSPEPTPAFGEGLAAALNADGF